MRAQVYRSAQREFACKVLDSAELVSATAMGALLKKGDIVVGDWVRLELAPEGHYQIIEVEERKSEIFRFIIRENKKKVTAANCDLLIIVCSVSRPAYKRGIVDRFLVRSAQWGIPAVVAFNKMDEYDPDEMDILFERDRLASLGVECFEMSAKFMDYQPQHLEQGPLELRAILQDKTSIFLGQSGVGKSQTITALTQGRLNLRTQRVGRAGKGAHTTSWSEIVDCDGFCTIDSPGIRSFALEDVSPDDLIIYFPDLAQLATECRFSNCQHEENSKDCGFAQFFADDSRSAQLILSRLESFKRIHAEVSVLPDWQRSR